MRYYFVTIKYISSADVSGVFFVSVKFGRELKLGENIVKIIYDKNIVCIAPIKTYQLFSAITKIAFSAVDSCFMVVPYLHSLRLNSVI